MGAGKRSSAGERVLEGRHVIGLFFLMLLFSGVFFTLGYVMGRNQLEEHVRAESTRNSDPVLPLKQDSAAKQAKTHANTPDDSASGSGDPSTAPPSSEWEFYRAGEKSAAANEHLKPAPAAAPKTVATSAKTTVAPTGLSKAATPSIPRGSYLLQVAAVRSENDALSLANDLRKKKFPAFVQTPQGDRYYRVQVGPYSDQKTMQTAKKGLETAGFRAIIKH